MLSTFTIENRQLPLRKLHSAKNKNKNSIAGCSLSTELSHSSRPGFQLHKTHPEHPSSHTPLPLQLLYIMRALSDSKPGSSAPITHDCVLFVKLYTALCSLLIASGIQMPFLSQIKYIDYLRKRLSFSLQLSVPPQHLGNGETANTHSRRNPAEGWLGLSAVRLSVVEDCHPSLLQYPGDSPRPADSSEQLVLYPQPATRAISSPLVGSSAWHPPTATPRRQK